MTASTPELPDERLIFATLAGDDEAFARLVARHKQRVFRLVARFAWDNDDLEDICQETFIKAYENLGKYRQQGEFAHWLAKIAVRCCHDALRKRKRPPHEPLEAVSFKVADEAEAARREAHQARELLAWAMGFLKADERLVITLLELEEKSVKETAELTGWSETNVKVRAWRARQALRTILEKHDAK